MTLILLTARLRRVQSPVKRHRKGPPERPDLKALKAPLVALLKQNAISKEKPNADRPADPA